MSSIIICFQTLRSDFSEPVKKILKKRKEEERGKPSREKKVKAAWPGNPFIL